MKVTPGSLDSSELTIYGIGSKDVRSGWHYTSFAPKNVVSGD